MSTPARRRDIGVIIVAGGSSTRTGGAELKQFQWVAGKPMLLHSVQTFMARPDVVSVVCVLPRRYAGDPPPWLFQCDVDRLLVSIGGRTRSESVANGLDDLPDEAEIVLVHDAARPLVGAATIDRVIESVRAGTSAIAALPVVSWLLGLSVLRGTPNRVHARPAGESLLASLPALWRNRRSMLSIWAYTCHNWELLGLWAWLPAFLTAALLAHGMRPEGALLFAALTYVANIAGSIVGGTMADRWGRTQTILLWSCVSLLLSFSIGWLISLPVALVVALACLYNFAAIADSSTHSTVLAESVAPHYLGVAYAVRSVVGFGAGVISPVVFGWALDLAGGGRTSSDALAWGLAWSTLGLGAVLGPLATLRLRKVSA